VILGLTPLTLLVAERDLRLMPEGVVEPPVNVYTAGLELSAAWPLCVLALSSAHRHHTITVVYHHKTRYKSTMVKMITVI